MSLAYVDARSSQCAGKIRHARSMDAKAAARRTMANGGRAMVAYHCRWGDHWHCGHPSSYKADRYRRQLETGVL